MASTPTTTTAGTADIDALLTAYLELLHTYTTLRSKLTALQSSTSLSLARANSTTPHHMAYTPTTNAKLRPTIRLHTPHRDDTFALLPVPIHPTPPPTSSTERPAAHAAPCSDDAAHHPHKHTIPHSTPEGRAPPPLPHLFGVLPTPSLRGAQASAMLALGVMVQVAAVEVKMRAVEVQVRRARKRARKAGKGREGGGGGV
ncbi:hypothetical protein VC83_05978 [Pseudogymnoascus destructans]|uniref:Vacuolar ATPase assembly protein VMA22 n=2 Tax=Pseudogymnoascus destructans TaxID=655981 RepID=L8G789_PSED2|nr:uncharacterized protein VC83_05978 [Pseudogymnoascus destructans]ELR08982.1 hypothetical protein GMDG_00600 [Pseudogymnoascus destructans 20631-21]OAF57148.1 hypothetical protein VC83_05978 [Pseudogymnoascus destructans]